MSYGRQGGRVSVPQRRLDLGDGRPACRRYSVPAPRQEADRRKGDGKSENYTRASRMRRQRFGSSVKPFSTPQSQ
jgi:hypothetical protein